MSSTATIPPSYETGTVLFIHALTSLHPGSGTALGTVDLPVQRERHTQWPVIAASSLKGVLRDAVRRSRANPDDLFAAFGPETAEAEKHAGAVTLTDGRILAFPVRALRGIFAWVTCPAVLERFQRDLSLIPSTKLSRGLNLPKQWPDKDAMLCPKDSPILIDGNQAVLEEFAFTRSGDADDVVKWIAEHAISDDLTRQRIQKHLVVLHDDDFTHFVRHATEITARIGLDYERKTVRTGALFYQEFLPSDTLFYSVVLANPSRRIIEEQEGTTRKTRKHEKSAEQLLAFVKEHLPRTLQIGGDETIGKGICAIRLL
ncbi:MAG: type III-B CRISPR module RAMP protein Cmr4 [Gemmatales bacterium]|nr:type III-B CRISPR module RAMP protein Cmr4 [Gemmatales bacterium]